MPFNESQFESVCSTARQAAIFQSAADALEWDERTGMPLAAGGYRAQQVSTLRSSAHQLRTDDVYGDALQTLLDQIGDLDPHSDQAATVRGLHRDFVRDKKLPIDLVTRLSVATVRGQQVWDDARKRDSFDAFQPALDEIIRLKRDAGARMAEGTSHSVYEALLDEYEPDAQVDQLNPVFSELKQQLSELIVAVTDSPQQPNITPLQRDFAISSQREFSRNVAGWVGFDFARGRLDETSHPFCTTLGPNDCRILTRYESNWLPSGLFGTLHEAGHGMYEQGLRSDWFGLPPGNFVSLGIHESQSRLWENQVGRSRPFWEWLYPKAVGAFPEQLSSTELDEFYFAINQVRPSLIRVEADEATYNLHILIRFELEQALINDELSTSDLPDAWNRQYKECLGITPPSNADGVLQDVHWSAGLFGYFPTYTLGNLAAAQLFDAASDALGNLDTMLSRGEFAPLLEWLRDNVHRHGRCYSGSELVENATGSPLSSTHLMRYLENKLRPLYGI
ncbi:Thermostable carboxypeptidase 1 [Stieleria maiorica]|uniref:Metal-dependent carboxypeptidase n=1 Tax=Stieleria maiorica TaxID=2795974 RepID=A0A5B9MJC1_9BACT|nr:carboxypeptidase M32 [Stieleria maiorica]QEF99137.1 Thermostable carboxypeptidase 1 [Stieleria maiorica]